MGWYRVVKTIKGHRYLYAQRTWREGKKVRTESRYIGPADGEVSSGGGGAEPPSRAERFNITEAPRTVLAETIDSTFDALLDPNWVQTPFDQAWSFERGLARQENLVEPVEKLDNLYIDLHIETTEKLDSPSFDRHTDCINMPPKEAYYHTDRHTATERYYRSKMHELIHWTGAEKRLDRLPKSFDMRLYAREELVAEAGAPILLKTLGCAADDLSAHVTYFRTWLQIVMKKEEALAFARQETEKAVNYLLEHGTKRV